MTIGPCALALEGRILEDRLRGARVEESIRRHGNILEAIEADGRPFRTLFLSGEHGFSMAAGQYLELALG